jgi:threonylcarbamoyladenosine tRNA methylthiotransferase MtaB
VPHLRGRSRSRPVAEIVAEAKELAKTTKEIVFTGIDISAFGRERGEGLITLVRALGAADVRKRLGSLECGVIDGDFLRALTDSGFCDHLHLSMQSGSDGVLRRMNRRYTAAEFIRKTQQIRDFMPDCGIMSDIICGFPGETDAEFNETLQTLEQIRFGGVHVFVYSERDGTAAAKMPQLPKSVRRERAKIVSELTERHKREFLTSQLGKVKDVYVEENGGAFNTGYTSNYIKVYTRAPLKSMTPHKLNEIYKEGVKGHYE